MDIQAIDMLCQFPIILFGITSQLLVAHKNKWGFVVAIFAQPFWYITTSIHSQWGILALSIIYTFILIRGIHVWFFRH